jgi:hypothetical protein
MPVPSVGVKSREAPGIAVDAIREAVAEVLHRYGSRMRFVDLERLRNEISSNIERKIGLRCYYEEPPLISNYISSEVDVERGVELVVEEKHGWVVCDLDGEEVVPLGVITRRIAVLLGKPGHYLVLPAEKAYVLILYYKFLTD